MLRVLAVLVLATRFGVVFDGRTSAGQATSPFPSGDAQTFTISGIVTSDGPVSGVTVNFFVFEFPSNVTIADFNVVTGGDGRFSATVPRAHVHLHFTPPPESGITDEHLLNIDVDRDLSLIVPLPRSVEVSGRWVPPVGVQPGATVIARSLEPGPRGPDLVSTDGEFNFAVRPGRYSIQVWPDDRTAEPVRLNVDARQALTGLVIPANAQNVLAPEDPPRLSLIQASPPDPEGFITVTGAPGSVAALALVLTANLQTGHIMPAVSDASGAFSARLYAPPGSFVEIKHDPTGRYALRGFPDQEVPAGTVLYVPEPEETLRAIGSVHQGSRFDFARARILGAPDVGSWILSAPFDGARWQPGSSFLLEGTLTVQSKDFESPAHVSPVAISGELTLEQAFDAAGRQGRYSEMFLTRTMTPTGFPHDNVFPEGSRSIGSISFAPLHWLEPGIAETTWQLSIHLPGDFTPGHYRLLFGVRFSGLPPQRDHPDALPSSQRGAHSYSSPARIVRIGTPARPGMTWVLAIDESSNGARGVVASEDDGRFAIANHVVFAPRELILPLGTYRLEPFAPLIGNSNGNLPDPPQVAFRFPSGDLHVEVIEPDGTRVDLGHAAFVQPAFRSPSSRRGLPVSSGLGGSSAHVSDFYSLSTATERFDFTFGKYGRHEVRLTGVVDDVWGNTYSGSGTYIIHIARPLQIEPAVIPGTPFETGDVFSASLRVNPPLPAALEVAWKHLPLSDETLAKSEQWTGTANRFGFAFLPAGAPIGEPGEYRVDIRASHVDPDGTYWLGSMAFGTVVETADSGVVLHGRRGFQDARTRGDRWMTVRNADLGAGHLMFPYESGDVMWMKKDDNAAAAPALSMHDPSGVLAARIRELAIQQQRDLARTEERITIGEIPFHSSCRRPDCQQAYWYAYAERPSVRVRELVSEDNIADTYWRFHDLYQLQLGTGANSDLPNDFKFQFGGSVFRDPEKQLFVYGAYASLFVLLPDDDGEGGRIMPPFQGNGGGPSGGPLFELKGRDIDLFFHPTAVRPGTILHRGAIASFAGYSAPPLPSKIEIVVTSPSGRVRTISGQANKIGYFHDPSQNFTAGESGVWKARVRIVFDGRTSAGQVTEPFPTGDVLGSREGEFYFYVVDASADDLSLAPMAKFVRPADGPVPFSIEKPAGLTNAQLTYTTTMPGFILEEGTRTALSYTYDAQKLAKDFPNLDLYDMDGYAGVDTITISFLVSGTQNGKTRHYARQIVIQGEELQMPEQDPRPKRRAVR